MAKINLDDIKPAGLENVHDNSKIDLSKEKIDVIPVIDERKPVKLNASDIINIVEGAATQKALEYLGAEPKTGKIYLIVFAVVIILIIMLSIFG
jgi:hypothetical protein